MKNGDLKFASLFSGCGGFDLGFLAQGFRPQGAYDCDPGAIENFRANIDSEIHNADLTEGISNERALYGIDALIAGPPCQGFSTAGKRQFDDKRNHLLTLTGDLALRIRPKVLVVENVAGALSGAHARYWKVLDETMRQAGYQTNTIQCQTTDLGMAQSRKRVMLYAWRTRRIINFNFPRVPAGKLSSILKGLNGQANHHTKRLSPQSREWLIARRIKQGQKLSNVRGGVNSVATWDIPEVFGAVGSIRWTCLRRSIEFVRLLAIRKNHWRLRLSVRSRRQQPCVCMLYSEIRPFTIRNRPSIILRILKAFETAIREPRLVHTG